jgi:hypothetical protein
MAKGQVGRKRYKLKTLHIVSSIVMRVSKPEGPDAKTKTNWSLHESKSKRKRGQEIRNNVKSHVPVSVVRRRLLLQAFCPVVIFSIFMS